ncbi:hypothetical protein SLNSH_07070 [Alsobacter soli]|uniref:VWFA domain-containing protein n=1 Tax=Alsobacter soli TaxID=2109933 RepID=A0A2T1HVQ4_9HYPH|nr:pilus assembly protein [Alsobacter soli]PSC05734.1 hypothetical protein SLNSH_07070 [Alsobacter soli]
MRTPHHFRRDADGAVAVVFAVLFVPLVIAIGAAVDYSRASSSRAALQSITDSTALAVANPKYTADQVQHTAEQIINSEVQDRYAFLGNLNIKATLSADGKSVTVQTSTTVKNEFMSRFGNDVTGISAVAQAFRAVTGSVELALVLDTTGSMNEPGKNKLTTLKSAANSMIDTLTKDTKADVKIGVVPFAQYVNVGMSNRNQPWISGATDYSKNSCTPGSCKTVTPVVRYYNCVKNSHIAYNDGIPYTWYSNDCQVEYGTPYEQCTQTTCADYWYKWNGCVKSRPHPLNLSDDKPSTPYAAIMTQTNGTPGACASPIQPLTTNYGLLKSSISALTAQGETYLPAGLVWGLNVLSPDQPFSEGAAYDPNGKMPRKVMVFMTDGVNTKSLNASSLMHDGTNRSQADDYTKKLCANIKAKGIEIYSIALMVDDADAKTMLQNCASGGDHYFDATNSSMLTSVFSQIATSLQTTYLGR